MYRSAPSVVASTLLYVFGIGDFKKGVEFVALMHERLGKTASEIAVDHDLSFAEIYAALTYYYDHRDEVDTRSAEDRALVEQLLDDAEAGGDRISA